MAKRGRPSTSSRPSANARMGSVAAAAYELDISETTARQHLSGPYRRTGGVNAVQAAYWLGLGHRDSQKPTTPVDQLGELHPTLASPG